MYLCIHRKCIPIEGYLAQGRTSFMKRHDTVTLLGKLGHCCDGFISSNVKSHATLNNVSRGWRDMKITN